jgi:hypothetical protein
MVTTKIRISKNGSSAFFGESVSSLIDMSSHTQSIDSCYNAVAVDMISANFFQGEALQPFYDTGCRSAYLHRHRQDPGIQGI